MTTRSLVASLLGALLMLGLSPGAGAEEGDGRRELVRDALQRERTRGLDDGVVDPTPWEGLPDDPRRPVAPTNPLPGIAWSEGGPGSGGGSGGPAPFGIGSFEIAPLPCPAGAVSCGPHALNDSGTRVVGNAAFEDHEPGGCGPRPRRRAVAWDLDDEGGVTRVHVLPNDVAAGEAEFAVALEATDAGTIVGMKFGGFYPTGREGEPPCSIRFRPCVWRQVAIDAWVQQDLPLPDLAVGVETTPMAVTADEWVVAVAQLDLDGDGVFRDPNAYPDTNRYGGHAWIPDAGEPSGYRIEELPLAPGYPLMELTGVSEAGLVVGTVDESTAFDDVQRAAVWERSPSGEWSVTLLETAGGDRSQARGIDADGVVFGASETGEVERFRGNDWVIRHAVAWARSPVSGLWLAPEDLGALDGDLVGTRASGSDGSGLVVGRASTGGLIWDRGEVVLLQERVVGDWEFHDEPRDVGGWHRMVAGALAPGESAGGLVLLIPQTE